MNKIITMVSFALAVSSFIYMFNSNIRFSCIMGIASLLVLILGFRIEKAIKINGNNFINKIIYHCTSNDKKYNFVNKHFTYQYLGNNKYICVKKHTILPTCKNLDRINDRFLWSANAAGSTIRPTQKKHEINKRWQQDIWSCYTIYFNTICKKGKEYKVGSVIDNLIDNENKAEPFISTTIDRKTKELTLVVKIPKDLNPMHGQLKVYSSNNKLDELSTEDLTYDDSIMGFSKTINYPRKGWKYVISWEL